jgi:uncharacterized protein (DUF302 family)
MGDVTVRESRYAYAETRERLIGAIHAAGATLFAAIDQSEAAGSVGLSLRPTTLLVFGNPKAGTQVMAAFPLSALDLPLKFAIWDDGGAVRVAFTPARVIATRYGITGLDPTIVAMDHALEALVAAVG